MEKWIILREQNIKAKYVISEELLVLNNDYSVKTFPSLNKASEYREENEIDGQCVKLPTWDYEK